MSEFASARKARDAIPQVLSSGARQNANKPPRAKLLTTCTYSHYLEEIGGDISALLSREDFLCFHVIPQLQEESQHENFPCSSHAVAVHNQNQ